MQHNDRRLRKVQAFKGPLDPSRMSTMTHLISCASGSVILHRSGSAQLQTCSDAPMVNDGWKFDIQPLRDGMRRGCRLSCTDRVLTIFHPPDAGVTWAQVQVFTHRVTMYSRPRGGPRVRSSRKFETRCGMILGEQGVRPKVSRFTTKTKAFNSKR